MAKKNAKQVAAETNETATNETATGSPVPTIIITSPDGTQFPEITVKGLESMIAFATTKGKKKQGAYDLIAQLLLNNKRHARTPDVAELLGVAPGNLRPQLVKKLSRLAHKGDVKAKILLDNLDYVLPGGRQPAGFPAAKAFDADASMRMTFDEIIDKFAGGKLTEPEVVGIMLIQGQRLNMSWPQSEVAAKLNLSNLASTLSSIRRQAKAQGYDDSHIFANSEKQRAILTSSRNSGKWSAADDANDFVLEN